MFFLGEMTHVTIQLNPKRHTRYIGSSTRRIWDAVYYEKCSKCNSM